MPKEVLQKPTNEQLDENLKFCDRKMKEYEGQIEVCAIVTGVTSPYIASRQEALEKSKGLTNRQRLMVKNESIVKRIDAHIESGSPVRAAKASVMMSKISKAKDRAKLDAKTLASRAVIDTLTPSDLPEIMNEQKLDAAQKKAITDRIKSSGLKNHKDIEDYLGRGNTNSLVVSYWT